MGKRDSEMKLLDNYGDDLVAIGEKLATSENKKKLQKLMTQKIEIYEKQLNSIKSEFSDDNGIANYESWLYHFKALYKVSSQGLLRRMSSKTNNSAMAIASGLIAKQQEKAAYQEAIQLLDKAIQLNDNPAHHFTKADVYNALKQKENAIRELSHIIDHFPDDTSYLEARKMKDELENPPKKGCFIATSVYGSYSAPEVMILRNFRDQVLLKSMLGNTFVKVYYSISPSLAKYIDNKKTMKHIVKRCFIDPIVDKLKNK